jgi:hypothetical protein
MIKITGYILSLSLVYGCSMESPTFSGHRTHKPSSLNIPRQNDTLTPNNNMNSNSSTDHTEDPRNGNGRGSGM